MDGPAAQLDQGLAAVDENQNQVIRVIGQRPRPDQRERGLHLVDVESGNPPQQVGNGGGSGIADVFLGEDGDGGRAPENGLLMLAGRENHIQEFFEIQLLEIRDLFFRG